MSSCEPSACLSSRLQAPQIHPCTPSSLSCSPTPNSTWSLAHLHALPLLGMSAPPLLQLAWLRFQKAPLPQSPWGSPQRLRLARPSLGTRCSALLSIPAGWGRESTCETWWRWQRKSPAIPMMGPLITGKTRTAAPYVPLGKSLVQGTRLRSCHVPMNPKFPPCKGNLRQEGGLLTIREPGKSLGKPSSPDAYTSPFWSTEGYRGTGVGQLKRSHELLPWWHDMAKPRRRSFLLGAAHMP